MKKKKKTGSRRRRRRWRKRKKKKTLKYITCYSSNPCVYVMGHGTATRSPTPSRQVNNRLSGVVRVRLCHVNRGCGGGRELGEGVGGGGGGGRGGVG